MNSQSRLSPTTEMTLTVVMSSAMAVLKQSALRQTISVKNCITLSDGRRCGSLAADNRQLESNTKLIGRPVPEISSFEISKMATGHHLGFGYATWRRHSVLRLTTAQLSLQASCYRCLVWVKCASVSSWWVDLRTGQRRQSMSSTVQEPAVHRHSIGVVQWSQVAM